MKIYVFLITFLFLGAQLDAQTYFNKRYSIDTYSSTGGGAVELPGGGYLLVNTSYYLNNVLMVYRVDANGDTVFTKRYYRPSHYYFSGTANSLIPTFDGNYATAFTVTDPSNNYNMQLVKLTVNGDTLWTKEFGGNQADFAYSVFQTPDSGLVICGSSKTFSTGSQPDFFVVKTDKDGQFLWQQNYGNTYLESCSVGQVTLDGGFIFSGHRSNKFYIVKTDNAGNFQWDKEYLFTDGVAYIKQCPDSTYLLAGGKDLGGTTMMEACLIKLSSNGTKLWEKTYGTTKPQQFTTVPILLADGSIVCAGNHSIISGFYWGMLVKTDSAGNQLWYRIYYDTSTSTSDYFHDAQPTAGNGFILSGTSTNGWMVKVDSMGCEIAGCTAGLSEFYNDENALSLFPNPVSGDLYFSIPGQNPDDYHFTILNILGEVQKTERSHATISVSGLSTGVYFLSAISKDGKKSLNKKFVKD